MKSVTQPTSTRAHGLRAVLEGALAILVGMMSVAQSRINGTLALNMGSGIAAAALSFGTGLILVIVIVSTVPSARRGVRTLIGHLQRPRAVPLWIFLGGIGGASFVAAQGIVVPIVGVALFTIAIVSGLTVNSLVADGFGVGPGGKRPVTIIRVIAALLAIIGVVISVSGTAGGTANLIIIVAFIAGALVALQQGVNGRVAQASGSPLTAGLVNFIVGFAALAIITAIFVLPTATVTAPPAPWDQPVLWLSGPIGVTFVVIASFVVRGLGVLLFSLLSITGQLLGGVIVQAIIPMPGITGVSWQTWFAVIITIGATVLAFLGSRRPPGTMGT